MSPDIFLASKCKEAVAVLYGISPADNQIQIQSTRKEFEGDYTLVVFPLVKLARTSPEACAEAIGQWLCMNVSEVASYNVIKGFLNISLSPLFWNEALAEIDAAADFGQLPDNGKTVMVEFSSPNTNKPLHLGHVRNILLGWSVSELMKAGGYKVIRVNLVNDRGIHICKSMIAWLKAGNGITPQSSGIKGDHLVGDFYVKFNEMYKAEVDRLVSEGRTKEEAEKNAPILKEAQEMLVKWERGDEETVNLWKTMNGWVYEGFDKTYDELGISFDKTYYESQTYLLGKSLVQRGLDMGVFEKAEDGSVWCDLTADGLDRKLLLRKDGTSVYMTQDLGTASQRFAEFNLDEHIYVVGNEQNYHFQVLKLILGKLGFPWAASIHHLSYGMVELPDGKMKSREGTVVDADDLIGKMYDTAREMTREHGKTDGFSEAECEELSKTIGLGALKYFIIKVDPKKTMLFDPNESIDFNGNTGPFIQYTHARIKSILRKADENGINVAGVPSSVTPSPKEIRIIKILNDFPSRIQEGVSQHSPAVIANYAYDLAKEFNQYYHDTPILKEPDKSVLAYRLVLISDIAKVLVKAMGILGITLPERM